MTQRAELYQRLITGAAIIVVVSSCILAGPVPFLFLNMTLGIAGVLEFYHLHGLHKNVTRLSAALILALTLFICTFYATSRNEPRLYLLVIPATGLVFLNIFFSTSPRPFEETAMFFLGHIYVILPVILFYRSAFVLHATFHYEIALGCFILLWASDTGAYVFGKLFGRHPLAPVISPKKTWEGSIGGALLAFLFSTINAHVFHCLSATEWMILALIIILFGTIGDLLKSRMKRALNVKDCGKILPGHGGVLDRFDSLIGSAPFVFAFLSLRQ